MLQIFRMWEGVIILGTILLFSTSGCMHDLEQDNVARSKQEDSVWMVAGQRRLNQFLFPFYLTFVRDQFHSLHTDGQKHVVALASQHSETFHHDEFLYVVDGHSGKVMHVIPSGCLVNNIVVGASVMAYTGTVDGRGDLEATLHDKIMIVRLPDGEVTLDANVASLGLCHIDALAIAGDTVCLRGIRRTPDGQGVPKDVFLRGDPATCVAREQTPFSCDFSQSQSVINQGTDRHTSILGRALYQEGVDCGNLRIEILKPGWLVAVTTQTEGKTGHH